MGKKLFFYVKIEKTRLYCGRSNMTRAEVGTSRPRCGEQIYLSPETADFSLKDCCFKLVYLNEFLIYRHYFFAQCHLNAVG